MAVNQNRGPPGLPEVATWHYARKPTTVVLPDGKGDLYSWQRNEIYWKTGCSCAARVRGSKQKVLSCMGPVGWRNRAIVMALRKIKENEEVKVENNQPSRPPNHTCHESRKNARKSGTYRQRVQPPQQFQPMPVLPPPAPRAVRRRRRSRSVGVPSWPPGRVRRPRPE